MNEELRNELELLAPTLAKIDNKYDFKAPDGYFESLPAIIQNRIAEEKPVSYFFEFIKELIKPKIAIPAFLLLFAVGTGWYYDNINGGQSQPSEFLSYDYLSNSVYFEDFEDEILFDELLADNGMEYFEEDVMFSDQDIESYIMNSQFNESIIFNEL